MSQEVHSNTVCLDVFCFCFFFPFWRASILVVVDFHGRPFFFIHFNGTVLFVAEVGAEKVSLVLLERLQLGTTN